MQHGWPTSSSDFQELSAALSSDFFVCALDTPGYGFSDKPDGYPYSMLVDAEIVETFIETIMKVDEVLLGMRLKDLEAEKDPARCKKIEIEIASLEAKLDWRTRIPTLALEKKKLEKEFMALDSFKPEEHKRATVVLKRLMDISQELDSLYTLRDGVEAVMKKKQWLLPRRGD